MGLIVAGVSMSQFLTNIGLNLVPMIEKQKKNVHAEAKIYYN